MNDPHVQVALNIDLDYPVSEYATGYDEEGEPAGRQITTLGDAITERAAHLVAERMFAEAKTEIGGGRWGSGQHQFYELHVKELVEAMIDAHIEERIGDLADALREFTGCDSLDAALKKIVTGYLDERTDRYSQKAPTRLGKLVAEAVGPRTDKAVTAVIADAKEKALASIAEVGERELGKALRQSIAAAAGAGR